MPLILYVCTGGPAPGRSGLNGCAVPVDCCCSSSSSAGSTGEGTLVVSVSSSYTHLGSEGYDLHAVTTPGSPPDSSYYMRLDAATSSGALYGTFRLLSKLQRGEPLPQPRANTSASVPAMTLRMWDLWDGLSGSITRGFAGQSIIWPMALYNDSAPPPRLNVYVQCKSARVWCRTDCVLAWCQPGSIGPC